MATIEVLVTPTPEGAGEVADPFRYGWRYVQREENGTLLIEQVPLTLEDVLHPREGDQVTHSAIRTSDAAATSLTCSRPSWLSTRLL